MQKVKDIFSDYQNKNEKINEADFIKADLYKKSNRLEVCLTSSEKIAIEEISHFEEYIINRFKVGNARIEIEYKDVQIEQTIEKDWKALVAYMCKKEPMSKAMLCNSTVSTSDSTICVTLKMKGKDFLCLKKFDKGLRKKLRREKRNMRNILGLRNMRLYYICKKWLDVRLWKELIGRLVALLMMDKLLLLLEKVYLI